MTHLNFLVRIILYTLECLYFVCSEAYCIFENNTTNTGTQKGGGGREDLSQHFNYDIPHCQVNSECKCRQTQLVAPSQAHVRTHLKPAGNMAVGNLVLRRVWPPLILFWICLWEVGCDDQHQAEEGESSGVRHSRVQQCYCAHWCLTF